MITDTVEIVQVSKPPRRWPHRTIITILVIVIVFEAYWLGSNHGLGTAGSAQAQKAELIAAQDYLADAVELMQDENAALKDKVIILEQQIAVDTEAMLELKRLVSYQQTREEEMLRRLNLYQGILATSAHRSGIRVNETRVKHLAGDDYRFELSLIQQGKHDRDARVKVSLKIIGKLDGQAAILAGNGLGFDAVSGTSTLKFRYFWEWDGIAKLPPGFIPGEVHVEIKSRKDKVLASEIYPWQDVLK